MGMGSLGRQWSHPHWGNLCQDSRPNGQRDYNRLAGWSWYAARIFLTSVYSMSFPFYLPIPLPWCVHFSDVLGSLISQTWFFSAPSVSPVPQVLRSCAEFVEEYGVVDGIDRLSGVSSNIQKLRWVRQWGEGSAAIEARKPEGWGESGRRKHRWQVLSKGGALVSSGKVDTMPHTSHRLDCTDACVCTLTCTHIHTPPLPHVPTQL